MGKPVATDSTHPAPTLILGVPPASDPKARTATNDVPDYIPGGRMFRKRLHDAERRQHRKLLPGRDAVPGMPHFAMRDPRTQGVAGALHVITHTILGAADPACVQAGTYIAMSDRQRAKRYVSRARVEKTLFEHRCVLRPASWMAPQGPATHLGVRPSGHGMP